LNPLTSLQPDTFHPLFLVTPTPAAPQDAKIEVGPPSGWVAAGLLALLLVIMLYKSLVGLIKRLFRLLKG
jgi:hypothetical protein